MSWRTPRIAKLICAAGLCGCPAPDDSGLTDDDLSVDLHVTATITDISPDPTVPSYVVQDRTSGGQTSGDNLSLGQQIFQAQRTVYVIRASFGESSDPGALYAYDAMVGPTPPLGSTTEQASAGFESGSLILVVSAGWAYVSGDWPVTDTGVVRTGTLGSRAPGEWIVHAPSGGKAHVIYNIGRGGSLSVSVGGELQETELAPGQRVDVDPANGAVTYSAYDSDDEFLRSVVGIAAAAGLTISP